MTIRQGGNIIRPIGRAARAAGLGTAIALFTVGAALPARPAAAQNYSEGYKFLKAVDEKDGQTVTQMLDAPGSTLINSRDVTNGRTALHIAVERRDVTWLRFLSGRGANPNIADNRGVTPLMRATQLGFGDGVEALVKAGARVDDANDAGETPLISAVHQRNAGLMRVLLRAGADPDQLDNSGRSARDYAELQGTQSTMLAEIEREATAASGRRASAEVYGPSL